jgi:hypothetical protein
MYVSQDLMWRKILKKKFVSRRTTRPQWSSTSPTNNQIPQKEIYHKARYRPSDPARPAGRLWVVAEAHGGGDAGRQKKAMSGVSTNSLLLGVAIRRFQGRGEFLPRAFYCVFGVCVCRAIHALCACMNRDGVSSARRTSAVQGVTGDVTIFFWSGLSFCHFRSTNNVFAFGLLVRARALYTSTR